MRAVEFRNHRLSFVGDAPEPDPADGEVIVDVLKAGICETDLQIVKGYMGFQGILGHEFVGVARSGRLAGRRVTGEINCPCGQCSTCRAGRPRHCPERTVLGIQNRNGAFADRLALPESCLHAVPDSIPDAFAVFTEPVAAACRILEQRLVDSSDSVLILGAGRLGSLCAQVLQPECSRLRVVGRHPAKLRVLADCGIETIDLAAFTPRAVDDVVIDCTGSADGLKLAMQCVRPCGTLVLKTTVAAEQNVWMSRAVIDEIRIVGSRCGPFEPALQRIADGHLQLAPLISATYDIEQVAAAFQKSAERGVLKVQLNIGTTG